MGPYIILICLILGAIGAWSIGGMLSKMILLKMSLHNSANLKKNESFRTEKPRRNPQETRRATTTSRKVST